MNENEEDDDIPLELKSLTICCCSFYRVKSPLEFEESWSARKKVVKCAIVITKSNLIEVENGSIKRMTDLCSKNVKKVIIHQEFEPFSRYVVLLTADMVAYMLEYKNLEVINSWTDVSDISSDDLLSEGKPKLILKLTSGRNRSVGKEEFLIETSNGGEESSRIEAIAALNNKLKSVVGFAESLEAERVRKETFIASKISDLSRQLQGMNREFVEPTDPTEPTSNLPSSMTSDRASVSNSSKGAPFLQVLSTRHRIVHNQWVIGVSVLNNSDKYLIRNPDILLHSEKSVKCLQYRTRVLRTYQKTRSKNSRCTIQESDVIIEDLKPPVIRPKRKAFLFAICTFPDFSYDETVSCNGIITYQTRSLRPDVENDETLRQTPFPCAILNAKNLNSCCADIVRDQGGTGLSLSVLSLIAASKCHSLNIKSLGSPLDQVIEGFSKEPKLIKAEGLPGFFCFYTPDCPPLHLASFICKPLTANHLSLKSYTKDDNQALILIHNISKYLPSDAFITPEESGTFYSSSGESFHEKLLPLMKSVISRIEDAFVGETNLGKGTEKRTKIEKGSNKEKYEMEEPKYCEWRKDISKLSLNMEMLYRDYMK